MTLPLLFWVLILVFELIPVIGIWKRFDLVRNDPTKWDSGWGRSYQKISPTSGGGPKLNDSSYFGSAVSNLGDLDGDGVEVITILLLDGVAPSPVLTLPNDSNAAIQTPQSHLNRYHITFLGHHRGSVG